MMTHTKRRKMFSERYFSKSAPKRRRKDSSTEAPCFLTESSQELEHQDHKEYLQARVTWQDNKHSVKQTTLTSTCRSSRESFVNIYSYLNLSTEVRSNLSQTLSLS